MKQFVLKISSCLQNKKNARHEEEFFIRLVSFVVSFRLKLKILKKKKNRNLPVQCAATDGQNVILTQLSP